MSVNRAVEDRRFAAEVMAVYRMSHGDRHFTEEYLRHKQEFAGEIYRIIDRNKANIERPALICHWPANMEKYSEKLKSNTDK